MLNLYSYRSKILVGKFLCAALVCMYGVVPYYLNYQQIYLIPWAESNLVFSLMFALIILFIPNYSSGFDLVKFEYDGVFSEYKMLTLFCFFVICFTSFSLWSWHEDRTSVGASVSAVCRALWVVNTFCFVRESEFRKLLVIIMTSILVFIDESRTYFIISFFVLTFSSKHVVKYFTVGMCTLLIVAAVRVGEGLSGFELLTYGLVGEGYNGAKPVGQIFELTAVKIDWVLHLLITFLQPIYFPFEFIANRLLDIGLPTQDSFFAEAVSVNLGEQLSPMGGWYILADFVYYGYWGLPLLFLYVIIFWRFTSILFDTKAFPYGPFIFFIAIKATPYVYIKFIYYIFIIALVLSFLGVLKKQGIVKLKI